MVIHTSKQRNPRLAEMLLLLHTRDLFPAACLLQIHELPDFQMPAKSGFREENPSLQKVDKNDQV